MSVSEWEQAKPAHHERRMLIMNEIHDIIKEDLYVQRDGQTLGRKGERL